MLPSMAQSAVDIASWRLDPDDPRAPSEAVWAAMSEAERAAVVAALSDAIPDVGELISRLKSTVERTLELEQQLEEAQREREEERRARDQEHRAREEAERKLDEALARIRELEKSRGES
jgi:hypothetical protein